MAHTTLTLNDELVLDDPLDTWQQRPPDELRELLHNAADTAAAPWLRVAMITLADATKSTQPVHITITTGSRGWTLSTRYG
jgi:hypothetical protein